jgi:peptidoglycan/LPS O-acetylase OafA/YrhL
MHVDWPLFISTLGTIGALLIAVAAVIVRRQRNEEVYQGLIFTGAFLIFIGFLFQALPYYIAKEQCLPIAQAVTFALFLAGLIFAVVPCRCWRPKKKPTQSARKPNQKRHFRLTLYEEFKKASETIGFIFLALGFISLIVSAVLVNVNGLQEVASRLCFPSALAAISLGLGSIAIGLTAKADKRYSEMLGRIRHQEQSLPYKVGDKITPSLLSGDYSREAARQRLNDDTQNNHGQQRGELYEVEKGKWAIHWGGNYPLDRQ